MTSGSHSNHSSSHALAFVVRNQPGLGKVGEERSEDVPGELGVAGGHGEVLAPDVGEDVLQVVAVSDAHVDLKLSTQNLILHQH